jgi:hypothetical protein
MTKILSTLLFLSVSVASGSMAQDISYLDVWKKKQAELGEEFVNGARAEVREKFDRVSFLFAKEMVKICHQSRKGMAAVYFSPAQYLESMQSYNRQMKKHWIDPSKPSIQMEIGAYEEMILNSPEYSTQKSIINGSSFKSGYDECNKWRVALQMAEFGL